MKEVAKRLGAIKITLLVAMYILFGWLIATAQPSESAILSAAIVAVLMALFRLSGLRGRTRVTKEWLGLQAHIASMVAAIALVGVAERYIHPGGVATALVGAMFGVVAAAMKSAAKSGRDTTWPVPSLLATAVAVILGGLLSAFIPSWLLSR